MHPPKYFNIDWHAIRAIVDMVAERTHVLLLFRVLESNQSLGNLDMSSFLAPNILGYGFKLGQRHLPCCLRTTLLFGLFKRVARVRTFFASLGGGGQTRKLVQMSHMPTKHSTSYTMLQ
jgi:hypothetical protein